MAPLVCGEVLVDELVQWSGVSVCTLFLPQWSGLFWGGTNEWGRGGHPACQKPPSRLRNLTRHMHILLGAPKSTKTHPWKVPWKGLLPGPGTRDRDQDRGPGPGLGPGTRTGGCVPQTHVPRVNPCPIQMGSISGGAEANVLGYPPTKKCTDEGTLHKGYPWARCGLNNLQSIDRVERGLLGRAVGALGA